MNKIRPHDPIKIIVGLISSEPSFFEGSSAYLTKKFGPVDLESEILPFNHTSYYQEEMGQNLKRKLLSFSDLAKPDGIEDIKLYTNSVEKDFSKNGRRPINIDPGYLTSGKLVLLTTKNYSHRIYLKNGIYAEVTLHYKNGDYQPWDWSYPDYKTDSYRIFFKRVRDIYMGQLTK